MKKGIQVGAGGPSCATFFLPFSGEAFLCYLFFYLFFTIFLPFFCVFLEKTQIPGNRELFDKTWKKRKIKGKKNVARNPAVYFVVFFYLLFTFFFTFFSHFFRCFLTFFCVFLEKTQIPGSRELFDKT